MLAVVEACTIVAALFRGNAPRRDVAATEPASFRKFRSGRKHSSSRCRPERAVGEFRSKPPVAYGLDPDAHGFARSRGAHFGHLPLRDRVAPGVADL